MIEVENQKKYSGAGVYVGRPSILGNPFRAGRDGSRDEVIEMYLVWLRGKYSERGSVYRELHRLARLYKADHALTLVCWCAPKRCHADVIAEAVEKIAGGAL